MIIKTFAVGALAAAAALTAAGPALAQAAAPAAVPPSVAQGPPIAGMCVISYEAAIGGSTVGKYVDTRLQQIIAQVNAELNAERTSLETDAKALEAQRATLDQNTLEQRGAGLQVRANALQRKAETRNRELQATQEKAVGRIEDELSPLVRQAYEAKNCAILLQANAVLIVNPAMNITPQVTTALNAKITQFAFDREHLDQGPVAASAPPIAQVPAPVRAPAKK